MPLLKFYNKTVALLSRLKQKKIIPSLFRSHWRGMVFFLLGLGSWQSYQLYSKLPDFEQVQASHKISDTLVLDRNGTPLMRLRTSHQQRSLDWLTVEQTAQAFQRLLIATEDQRFYQHIGFDILAIGHALIQNLQQNNRRGASTISMQVAKLLDLKKKHSDSSITSKIRQITLAFFLELKWSKRQILESYLNLIAIRGEILGVKAASFSFFNKAPDSLNAEESAILIALIRAPNAPPALVKTRACRILQGSQLDKLCQNLDEKITQSLANPSHLTRDRSQLPVFSKHLIENQNPGIINTALDIRIQNIAITALREQLIDLKKRNVRDGAVLILDTQTGKPLAYVGNAGPPWTEQFHIDGIQARRQLGSTLKPFIYATAFDLNILNLDSLVEDSKADIPTDTGQIYQPQNYDHSFRGFVSAAEALGSSLNVPAVRTLLLVRPQEVLRRLNQLGFHNLNNEDFYGPSLALGTVDASLWDLTHAYRNLAASETFSKETQQKIFAALSLPEYRRFTFGLDSTLNLPFSAAVKTGTSRDMRDNWCVGYNAKYTIGVWVGNFNGEPMWNVSGMTGAAPIWQKLMLALNPELQNSSATYLPPQPVLPHKTLSRIRYPVNQMILAYDPNIPKAMQKILLEIDNPQAGQKVFLGDQVFEKINSDIFLPIQRGRFRLTLKSKNNAVLDEVNFEVR